MNEVVIKILQAVFLQNRVRWVKYSLYIIQLRISYSMCQNYQR